MGAGRRMRAACPPPPPALLLLLALLLSAHVAPVRATSLSQVPGVYALLQSSARSGCPQTVTHATAPSLATGSPVLTVAHSSITTSAGACWDGAGSGDRYTALLSADAYTTMLQSRPNRSDPLLEALLRTNALFGNEAGDRACGKFVMRKGTVVAFVNSPKEEFLENFDGLKEGKTLMFMAETQVSSPKRCVYMSESAISDRSASSGSNCFPGSARFHLHPARQHFGGAKGERTVRADELAHGSPLSTGPVIAFTHRQSGTYKYVRFTATSGAELVVSPGHYVVLRNGRLRAAHAVRIGDVLAGVPRAAGAGASHAHVVASIDTVQREGRYNPHTRAGLVHVDGYVVSSTLQRYTRGWHTQASVCCTRCRSLPTGELRAPSRIG
jgi:Hint module